MLVSEAPALCWKSPPWILKLEAPGKKAPWGAADGGVWVFGTESKPPRELCDLKSAGWDISACRAADSWIMGYGGRGTIARRHIVLFVRDKWINAVEIDRDREILSLSEDSGCGMPILNIRPYFLTIDVWKDGSRRSNKRGETQAEASAHRSPVTTNPE